MTANPWQAERLRHLRRVHKLLAKFLEDPEFYAHDLYVPMAGDLRLLLCDRKHPVLIEAAEAQGMSLRVWGPYPPGQRDLSDTLLTWTTKYAGSKEYDNSYIMTIQEYLDTPIGVAMLGIAYTPGDIIRWVANKEGAAHLDMRKPSGLMALRDTVLLRDGQRIHSSVLRDVIADLTLWCIDAIDDVMAASVRSESGSNS
jgi:hypothetical protein